MRYYQIATDPEALPPETTWDLMTNQPGKIERTVGNTFGYITAATATASTYPRLVSLPAPCRR